MSKKLPLSAVVYLTDYCYLKCKHCFFTCTNELNKHHIDYKRMLEILDDFVKNNVCMVAFTGGDPLIHPYFLEIVTETVKRKMLPLLGISGVNITEDIANKIAKSGIHCVQIGLNGSNNEINKLYRGEAHFRETMKAIELLQNKNINVNLSFCIDKNNFNDYKNMIYLAKKLNIYKVKIEYWVSIDSKNKAIELTREERDEIYQFCKEYEKTNNIKGWILCPSSKVELMKIHHNAIVIMPNGDMKYSETASVLGNIYNKLPSEIIKEE